MNESKTPPSVEPSTYSMPAMWKGFASICVTIRESSANVWFLTAGTTSATRRCWNFIAENPIRRGTLPANIVSVAEVILEAGARAEQAALNGALELVCPGRVPRECGVQLPLIDLLCDSGANPNRAMPAALAHGEFDAVNRLIQRGAIIDLPVTAATGRTEEARQSLAASSGEDRHRAFALAAQFGHTEIGRSLLRRGSESVQPARAPRAFHSPASSRPGWAP
jgi:hypothetical protein